MKFLVEQIAPQEEEEVRVRCHDTEEKWVEAIRAVTADQAFQIIGKRQCRGAAEQRKDNQKRKGAMIQPDFTALHHDEIINVKLRQNRNPGPGNKPKRLQIMTLLFLAADFIDDVKLIEIG